MNQKQIEAAAILTRIFLAGLAFNFEQSLIEHIACSDEIDRQTLQFLYEAGSPGLLPNYLQRKLANFKTTRHQISRRIQVIIHCLEKEFGEDIAEKRGAIGL